LPYCYNKKPVVCIIINILAHTAQQYHNVPVALQSGDILTTTIITITITIMIMIMTMILTTIPVTMIL